jgi:ELWxxDGT repeat protein
MALLAGCGSGGTAGTASTSGSASTGSGGETAGSGGSTTSGNSTGSGKTTGAGAGTTTSTGSSTSSGAACVDADHDGHGDNCAAGPDCDDNDPAVWDLVPLYTDADGDGYSLEPPGSPVPTCIGASPPPGYSTMTKGWDCDDTSAQLTTHCPSRLVKDINQVPDPSPGSAPHAIAGDLSGAYFAATDSRNGTELWYTNLTTNGTKLVVDLAPGPASSNPQMITSVGGLAYFVATTPEYGAELWKTDGTAANTALVADLVAGAGSSTITAIEHVNTRVYFVAKTGGTAFELWQSDGDAASTKKVSLSGFTNPTLLTTLGNSLFVLADSTGGQGLFRVDANGATKVYPTGSGTSKLTLLTRIGAYVYYVDNGLDIRRANETSDALFYSMAATVQTYTQSQSGTCWNAAGTIEHLTAAASSKVAFDIHAQVWHGGSGGNCGLAGLPIIGDYWYVASTSSAPVLLPGYGGINTYTSAVDQRTSRLVSSGGTIYFTVWNCDKSVSSCAASVTDEKNGTKTLWRFDGTNAQQVFQLPLNSYFDALTPAGNSIYWRGPAGVANNVTQGQQGDALWLNGAPTSVSASNGWSAISPFGPVSGGVYLSATKGGQGELYFLTAGSSTPTPLVTPVTVDVANAQVVSIFQGLSGTKDHLVFPGDDQVAGSEPWVSDNTAAGTKLLDDINTAPGDSSPFGFAELGVEVLFSADDGSTGTELWSSDGTSAGTVQVKDIWSGNLSSAPALITVINGVAYFSADDGYAGTEMWATHGVVGDPVRVADIYGGLHNTPNGPVPNASFPGPYVDFAGKVFFPATQGPDTNVELFSYAGNGMPVSATLVKEVNPSSTNGSHPRGLVVANNKLFFVADDGTNGEQLWVSDGTNAGTTSLKQASNPKDALKQSSLAVVGQQVFFAALDGTKGRELWVSDGTLAGTKLVDDINPSGDSNPDGFAVINDTLYFAATDKNSDRELWMKAGAAAAQRVAAINPTGSSKPDSLVVAGDTLFFVADDGVHGRELCVSKGTSATTSCFDLLPGARGARVSSIVAVAPGRVVFAASDGVSGVELWQSDGTAAGTVIVDDIAAGPSSSNPTALVWSPALERVFFQADDGAKGVELRTISLPSLGP